MLYIEDYRIINCDYSMFMIEKREKFLGLFYIWKCFLIISEDIWNNYNYKLDGLHSTNIHKTEMIINLLNSKQK